MITKNINRYIKEWKQKDYENDIPDEVPDELMKLNLAPSYKAIALALLKNDHNLKSLGFTPKKSKWYSAFKKVEIEERDRLKGKKEVKND
jgi:predicted phosphoadenosine phosphosulfate sulfurtransferase